jgi:integrase/recombinase XerC
MRRPVVDSGAQTVSRFLQHCRLRNLAPATIDQRERALRRLGRFMGAKGLLALDHDDLDEWWGDCGRLSPEGRACELSHVRSFYRWCVAEAVLEVDPTRRLMRPKLDRRLPRPIGDDKLAFALAAADDRQRAILMLAGFAGLRAGEIARLRVEDIVLDEEPPVVIVRRGKGAKDRIVPVSPPLVTELRDYIGPRARGFVFANLDGRPGQVPEHRISQVSNRFLHDNGIRETLHQLRHRFGTVLYRRSKDLRLVQEMMGHASPVTTSGYAAFAPEAAAVAVAAASILNVNPLG